MPAVANPKLDKLKETLNKEYYGYKDISSNTISVGNTIISSAYNVYYVTIKGASFILTRISSVLDILNNNYN